MGSNPTSALKNAPDNCQGHFLKLEQCGARDVDGGSGTGVPGAIHSELSCVGNGDFESVAPVTFS